MESPSTRISSRAANCHRLQEGVQAIVVLETVALQKEHTGSTLRLGRRVSHEPFAFAFVSYGRASFSSCSHRQSSVSSWSVIPSECKIFLSMKSPSHHRALQTSALFHRFLSVWASASGSRRCHDTRRDSFSRPELQPKLLVSKPFRRATVRIPIL